MKVEESKKKSIIDTISASLFAENCAYGGFEDGLICCWNLKVETLFFFLIYSFF